MKRNITLTIILSIIVLLFVGCSEDKIQNTNPKPSNPITQTNQTEIVPGAINKEEFENKTKLKAREDIVISINNQQFTLNNTFADIEKMEIFASIDGLDTNVAPFGVMELTGKFSDEKGDCVIFTVRNNTEQTLQAKECTIISLQYRYVDSDGQGCVLKDDIVVLGLSKTSTFDDFKKVFSDPADSRNVGANKVIIWNCWLNDNDELFVSLIKHSKLPLEEFYLRVDEIVGC